MFSKLGILFYVLSFCTTIKLPLCHSLVRPIILCSIYRNLLLFQSNFYLFTLRLYKAPTKIFYLSTHILPLLGKEITRSKRTHHLKSLRRGGGQGDYLSISGITRSIIAMIATRSPILPPLAIWSSALRLLKPGDRNLILYGVVPPSLTIYTPNSPLAVSTLE